MIQQILALHVAGFINAASFTLEQFRGKKCRATKEKSFRIILRNVFEIEISNVEGASESINYGVLLVLFGRGGGGREKSAIANKDGVIQQETWLLPQKT